MCDKQCVVIQTIAFLDITNRIHDCFIACLSAFQYNDPVSIPHILANKISRMFYPLLRTQNDQFLKGIMHIKLLDRMNNDRFISNFDILFWLLCISHATAYSSG